jgi:uncharacterized protein YjdB
LLLAAACGGGGDGGPTQPPPVTPPPTSAATVTLDRTDLTLVPRQSATLVATPRDAGGAPLTGRSVTWSAGDTSIAAVSPTGVVTARSAGTTTVTAVTDGRSAAAQVVVRDGGLVGAGGGTVVAAGGAVRLVVPPGALAQDVPITVTPLQTPPAAGTVVTGTAYEFGPAGTTFSAPVTMEIAFAGPAGIDSTLAYHRLSRFTNGAWVPLPDNRGAQPGNTVVARTTSFSQYAVTNDFRQDNLVVTPANPTVFLGESVQLTVTNLRPQFVPAAARLERSWSGGATVSVSSTGLVTGVAPGGPATVTVQYQWFYECPLPDKRCYVGTRNAGTPQAQPLFIDTLSHREVGVTQVVVGLRPVASVTVAPAMASVAVGATAALGATLRDANGATLSPAFRTIAWSTTDAAVATVTPLGEVTGVAPGTATIRATVDGVSGSAEVTVTGSTQPVVSVTVLPADPTLEVGATLPLVATGRDESGAIVPGRPVSWRSLAPTVATVSQDGVVTALQPGTAPIGATIDGVEDGVTVTVVPPFPLVVGTPTTGGAHSCLLRVNGQLWCWGRGVEGQLGTGETPAAQLTPVPVGGGGFRAVSGGANHSCALDAGNAAWCWGENAAGQLGDGSTATRTSPAAVSGGSFAQLSAGTNVTCALGTDGRAWCWGAGGQTGDGTSTVRTAPVLVAGGRTYTTITAGFSGGCASGNGTWCWGTVTASSSLGNGNSLPSVQPVEVSGGHSFVQLTGGPGNHTCGRTGGGEVWCWGRNAFGQLGDGSTTNRQEPVRVASPVAFVSISAGAEHTCGLAADGSAWCWGLRGNVGAVDHLALPLAVTTPRAVSGGLRFTELSAGGGHSCGRAVDGTWCWGANFSGQLGSGQPVGVGSFGPPVKVRFASP